MIGETINGKYRIEAAFSESHMYEIFTASELDTSTSVVIKILKEEMACNAERVKGFSDEIRSFASLSHPMIAEILDVDMYEDRPYVVSQLVKGTDLHTILKNEALGFAECCRITQDLATVLQHAADQNVEYRTIKLSNVLRGSDGKLTVLSFTHPRLKLASRSARTANSGIHADLYFLGTTFYEMLAGESLIRKRGGANELWDMKLEQLLRIRHSDLTPEQIGRVLDFVRKTLTREMKLRFNSHEEFLKALADLSGVIRGNSIRNKARQLSMASQVVDALNGRMSNVNMNMPAPAQTKSPVHSLNTAYAQLHSGEQSDSTEDVAVGYAQVSVEGNLALVIDNSGKELPEDGSGDVAARKSSRPHLRLLKPDHSNSSARAEVWQSSDDAHWLRNPVIFMGICLVVMVFLILFW
ncbi:MAG: protein kinase [Candidatus Riflebacteria bacterium]|nr:protein kinase [Candidatus Riflebacteria bacterium]